MASATHSREKLDAYRRHHDAEAFAALVAEFRPMVERVCRRHLISVSDLDDAVQETFVKLARNADLIAGDVAAWLAAAAGTTALDFARRSLRRRNHTRILATSQRQSAPGLPWHLLQPRLDEALEGVDPATRTLVLSRFFEQTAVKEIARAAGITSSAMSRRVDRAVQKVRTALAKMGYASLEDALLGLPGDVSTSEPKQPPGVVWVPRAEPPPAALNGPRPLRIGVFVSQTALTTPNFDHFIPPLERQMKLITQLQASRYRLISLVEPGTQEYPMVERATRDFGLTAGMLDASDPDALRLLDVIFLGELQATSGRVLDAVGQVVQSGVGLFNGGFVGITTPGFDDPRVKRLFLTDHLAMYHTPGAHGSPRSATIHLHHPLLAPLGPGTKLQIAGCCPAFLPDPAHSQVLMTKDAPPDKVYPRIPQLLGQRMPVITLGTLGKGRVAIVAIMTPEPLATHPAYAGRFLMNIIDYLAQPRAAERAAWGL